MNHYYKRNSSITIMLLMFILLSTWSNKIFSQTIISTESGTNYSGFNSVVGNGTVCFVVENTNAVTATLRQVDLFWKTTSNGAIPKLWYSATSLSGAPSIQSPAWSLIATGTVLTIPTDGYYTTLSGLNFEIPAGTQYRFAIESNNGIAYSGSSSISPDPNTFSGAGINLKVGNFQIGGANIGYAGAFPSPTFNPRFFTGRIAVSTSIPTTVPNCASGFLPANNAVNVLSNGSISWSAAADVSSYEVYLGTTSTPSLVATVAVTSYQFSPALDLNTVYYYKITPKNAVGAATGCTTQSFTTTSNIAFCTPIASNCSAGDEILKVSFGAINNSSSGCSGTGYSDYSNTVSAPIFSPGQVAAIAVKIGSGSNDNAGVWIDFNRNGIFEAPEYTFIGYTDSENDTTLITNITIPVNASLGITRMRVRVRYGNTGITASDACSAFTYGETEDYFINVSNCKQPSTATVVPDTSICIGGAASLKITGGTLGDAIGWSWFTGNCGGTLVGNGTTIIVNPAVTTTYFARAQGGCVTPGVCAAVTVRVSTKPGAPVINTVSSICLNDTKALVINPSAISTDSLVVASAALSIAVPDNIAAGANTSLTVPTLPAGATVIGIDAKLNMTHSYIGDMLFNLKAPNGSIVALAKYLTGTGDAGEDFVNTVFSSKGTIALSAATAPFTGIFKPDAINTFIAGAVVQNPTSFVSTATNFAALYAVPAGIWTLAMADGGLGDNGILNNWTITIHYTISTPSFPVVWSPAISLFTDAAGTINYNGITALFQVYAKPSATATYTAVSVNGGCLSSPSTIAVMVNNPIVINAQPTAARTCQLGEITFSTSVTGTDSLYRWLVKKGSGEYEPVINGNNYFGSATKSLVIKNIPASWNGYQYRCLVSSKLPCVKFDTTQPALLTVFPTPAVVVNTNRTKLLPGISTVLSATSIPAAANYAWFKNGMSISNANSSTLDVTVENLGDYKTTVIDINGCTNSSSLLTIEDSVSAKLFVYPSPSNGRFQVSFYSINGNVLPRTLVMYDSKGVLVYNKNYAVSKPYDKLDVNFDGLGKGVYMINLLDRSGNLLATGKVLIQ